MSEQEPQSESASQDADAKIISLDEHWERFVRLRVGQGEAEADARELQSTYYSGAAVAYLMLAKLREEGMHARFLALHAEIRRYQESLQFGAEAAGPEENWDAYVRLKVPDAEPGEEVQARKEAYYAGAAMVFAIMMNANKDNYGALVESMRKEIERTISAEDLKQFTPIHIQIA